MTMVVKNNLGAVRTLNQVNKNSSTLKKNLEALASGIRLNSAETDASAYAVSRKMQAQIRALDQDQQNTQNARSLLNIAEGGIQSIVDELRTIKELAINAANDTNTDEDRLTMQKELFQRRDTINDLATETNYNGRRLLDGSCALKEIEIDLDPTAIDQSANTINITADGVYDISGANNKIIKVQAQNVKFVSDGTNLNEVKIQVETQGANLFIEEVHITNSNGNIINFSGGGDNVLTILGNNTLKTTDSNAAAVNIGDSGSLLIQEDEENPGGSLETSAFNGAAIGTDRQQTSTADLIITSGDIKAVSTNWGAAIGSGASASMGDIKIYGGTIDAEATFRGTAIGAGLAVSGGSGAASVGNILIAGGTVNAVVNATGNSSCGACIGSGYGNNLSSSGDIFITGGSVTVSNSGNGAGIGSGNGLSKTGDIIITNGTVTATNTLHGAGIGAGWGVNSLTGDIAITGGNVTATTSGNAAAIGSNQNNSSSSTITITGGTVKATATGNAAAIGSGCTANAKIGDIAILGGNVTAYSEQGGSAIGAGLQGNAGNITIADAVVDATSTSRQSTAIGGASTGTIGNINIYSGTVTAILDDGITSYSTAIGSGYGGTAGNINIYGGNVDAYANGRGTAIGAGYANSSNRSTVGNINISGGYVHAQTSGLDPTASWWNPNDSRINAIGKYDTADATVGNITANGSTYNYLDYSNDRKNVTISLADDTSVNPPTYNPPAIDDEPPEIPENPFEKGVTYDATNVLKFQTGTRANQNVTIGINDMHTTSLKSKIPSEADLEQLQEMLFNQKAYDALKAILDEAKDKTLDDVTLVPRKNAQVAIKVIDGALDYALNEATNVGAFSSRLEITENNIVTSSENLQAADSVINDTDMAKEMTAYTKNNVLLQASQSMLAQANQTASAVLGLLE